MRKFGALLKREVSAYFFSPIAYVVICFFLAVMGVSFWTLIAVMAEGTRKVMVMRALFSESIFFWIAILIVIPVVTMRLFAEEKHSGTFETLMTAPVGDATVVLAKYFGALIFFIAMWLPTLAYIWILRYFGAEASPVDSGLILASYCGVILMCGAYLSVGLFMSALTRNQITAAISAFAVIFLVFLAGFIPYFSSSGVVQQVGEYFSSVSHMIDFSHGTVDTRAVVFYLSIIILALFMTTRVVEARRWKQ